MFLLQGYGQDVTGMHLTLSLLNTSSHPFIIHSDNHAGLDAPQYVIATLNKIELNVPFLSIVYLSEQNPYAGAGPVTGKVLIVCPVTLINVSLNTLSVNKIIGSIVTQNWKGEFHKW